LRLGTCRQADTPVKGEVGACGNVRLGKVSQKHSIAMAELTNKLSLTDSRSDCQGLGDPKSPRASPSARQVAPGGPHRSTSATEVPGWLKTRVAAAAAATPALSTVCSAAPACSQIEAAEAAHERTPRFSKIDLLALLYNLRAGLLQVTRAHKPQGALVESSSARAVSPEHDHPKAMYVKP